MVTGLLLAVGGCGGSSLTNGGGGGGGPTATTSGTVGNNFFNPAAILVSAGAVVTWTWAGGVQHNVIFALNPDLSSGLEDGAGFQHAVAMPTAPGTYSYQCTIHPATMNGTVTVQ